MCHRAEPGHWLIPGLNLRRLHMTSLWEPACWGQERWWREGEVILGSGLEIQITFVNHKQIFITWPTEFAYAEPRLRVQNPYPAPRLSTGSVARGARGLG